MLSSFIGFISRIISLVSFSFPFSICFFDVFMCACLFVVLFHMRVFLASFSKFDCCVLRQKHDHVACGGGKSTAELGLQETQKNTFLTHTRFLVQKACSVETHSRSMVILSFSCGYTCAFPCSSGNTCRKLGCFALK